LKKVLIAILLVVALISMSGCVAWKRSVKDSVSSIKGLDRVAYVYSLDGKLLREYRGRFDIETSQNKVKFDLNGKRFIIYNAVVIVEEQ
jgi:hypothetical protein